MLEKMRGSLGRWCGLLFCLAISCVILILLAFPFLPDYRAVMARLQSESGTAVLDRNGKVLRLLPDADGQFCLWVSADRVPACLKRAVMAAEDQRFPYHPGFDPIAIVRAAYANLTRWRIVSGASTITQQVVRLIHPRPRTYRSKVIETLEAVKMEWQLSKRQIMELFLNLSPMGGNIRGVRLASRVYFGKDVQWINPAEAAVLAALPRSPSRFDPHKPAGRARVLAEKDRILRRMADLGWVSADSVKPMLGNSVRFTGDPFPLKAPHFVDFVLARHPARGPVIRTTLDLDVQQQVEQVLQSHRDRLARLGIEQVAAIVLGIQRGEVLAMVGSLGYRNRGQGFNNGVLAKRSAGSTLKPFLYALAIDQGNEAYSRIPDTFRTYASPSGEYMPHNSDRRSYGPVTVRTALGNSLNVSAVKVLQAVGTDEFHGLLKGIGILDENGPPPEHYGLGMAVGNVETSLLGLVSAYSALARGGLFSPVISVPGQPPVVNRVMSTEAAYIVSDILADPTARLLTFGNPEYFHFGFPVSVKTGTSTRYRDCWIVGYTSEHVIGLWAGNFDGRPTASGSGAEACGPILKDIIADLYRSGRPAPLRKPERLEEISICWKSGLPASPLCRHTAKELVIKGTWHGPRCDFPHDSDESIPLGGRYARWLFYREIEQGVSRYRLALERPGPLRASAERTHAIRIANTPLSGRTQPVTILHPHSGDRFLFSPYEEIRIRLRAVTDPPVAYVVWLVDGTEAARTPPPYEVFWKAQRGRHVIDAVTPGREAARVVIEVQ